MVLEAELEKLGMSKKEALIYLASLKLGLAKASDIAKKAHVGREAVYYLLKLLQQKGYMSEVIKSGVKYYSATQPKTIIEIIDEDRRQKVETVQEILPDLESLQKMALSKPKIEVYEGVDGFKTVVSKLVENEHKTIYGYVSEKTLHFLPTFHLQFRRKRKERRIRVKIITEKSKLTKEMKRRDKKELRETRFNNKVIKSDEGTYFILDDAVVLIKANEKEQLGVYIREESNASLQRKIFEQVWKMSE